MNQYFLTDIALKKGYAEHKPALKKLLLILYPHHDEENLWENPVDCSELNDTIDKFLRDALKKPTADLCLDYFAEMFGGGQIQTNQTTVKNLIHEIVRYRESIRKNIKERMKK